MYNPYKHKHLNEAAKAALRNERPSNNGGNKNTESSTPIELKKFNQVKRLSLKMSSDSVQVNTDDAQFLNDYFNLYKIEILEMSKEIESDDKAWAPIQEIMQHEDYLAEKPIQNRSEYKERLWSFSEIIERYVD